MRVTPTRWLNRTVAGAGVASALGDFCDEVTTAILPGLLAVIGIPAAAPGIIEAGPLLSVVLLDVTQGRHSADAAAPFRFVLWLSVIPGALAVLAFSTLMAAGTGALCRST